LYAETYRSESASWRQGTPVETFRKITALAPEESETNYRIQWIKDSIGDLSASGVVQREAPPHRLLDVGGATGVFAYAFQDDDWKSYVIDPDEHSDFIETQLEIPLIQKPYESGSFSVKFDLISLVFVLEHVQNPVTLLTDVRGDMRPNSLLYIEVPSEVAFKLKAFDDDIFNSCHLWFFGPHTITRLLNSRGFDVVALKSTVTIRGHHSLMTLAVLR